MIHLPTTATHPAPTPLSPSGLPASPAERAALRTDADLIEQFLRERCKGSPHTEASYRSQLRRLGWFCRWRGLRSIRELQREQWDDFLAYLAAPPQDHVMKGASVGFDQPGWAPFRGPLAERSRAHAAVVAKAFFAWMSDPAIAAVALDPVASAPAPKTPRRSATNKGIKRLVRSNEKPYIERAIQAMPATTPQQVRARARARWCIYLAAMTGLRASELASARSSMIRPGVVPGTWVLEIVRKGRVESCLPLHSGVLVAWRECLQAYADAVRPGQDLPLVLPLRDADLREPVANPGRAHVWEIVKGVVCAAADLARDEGDEHAEQRLRSASTHWLRHTFANDLLAAGARLVTSRDLLDHASLTTTNQYLHADSDQLVQDLERLPGDFLRGPGSP